MKEKNKIVVWSEKNLEEWNLFVTAKYKGKSREIVKKYENGEQKVIIGRTDEGVETGVLNAYDAVVFYGLVKLWEKAGKPTGPVNFSFHQLAEILGLEWGKKTHRFLRKHLARLEQIPLTYINSFYVKKNGGFEETMYFRILGFLNIFERSKDYKQKGQRYLAFSQFKFHDVILSNFLDNYIKPVRLDVIKELKGEIAIIIYRYLDYVMYSGNHEIELLKLAQICGLSLNQPLRKIKQVIKKALNEIKGKELSTGEIITKAEIEDRADRLVVVFEKSSKRKYILDSLQQQAVTAGTDKKIVWFRYRNAHAKEVRLAGSFNGWKPEMMGRVGDEWSLPVELGPGKYFYKFVVDGVWVLDPANDKVEKDSQGNENSVLIVEF